MHLHAVLAILTLWALAPVPVIIAVCLVSSTIKTARRK